MKILMIGGTGNISAAVSELLLRQGHELHLYCLDDSIQGGFDLRGAQFHYGDIDREGSARGVLNGQTLDVVVDWTVMTPEQAMRDLRLFYGRTGLFIFISSASAYQRPAKRYLITEDMPLENPFWEYSRNKIACETAFMQAYEENQFPVTIVRPSLTYGDTVIPYALNSWSKPWSLVDRLLKGKRVVVPGDGTSLWVVTHSADFAKGITGLMGNERAIGEAFHITSDEVLTWNDILSQIAEAVGAEARPVHISSEFITAFLPGEYGSLFGDKTTSVVFDNRKIKSFVPDFKATMPFCDGIARTAEFLRSHPALQSVDDAYEAKLDRLIAAHDVGVSLSRP